MAPRINSNVIISPSNESSVSSDVNLKSEDVCLDECVESKACLIHETLELVAPATKDATQVVKVIHERNVS